MRSAWLLSTLWRVHEELENNTSSEPCQYSLTSRSVSISRGIFQGDPLFPLLFFLALAPLSTLLNESGDGCKIYGQKVTNLFLHGLFENMLEHQTCLLKLLRPFKCDDWTNAPRPPLLVGWQRQQTWHWYVYKRLRTREHLQVPWKLMQWNPACHLGSLSKKGILEEGKTDP